MLLTPTYHVFEMYKVHHDATRLPIKLEAPDYELDGRKMPALSASASRDDAGNVHVSIVNAHARDAVRLECELENIDASQVSGRILTHEKLDAHNTFAEPDRVKPAAFDDASVDGNKLQADVPPRSVVVLRLAK
jgi:alpha-N-arabinofuranosidase